SGTSNPLNDTLINDLMAGKLYGNIHTQNHPGGEIRAQITKQ
ncbi:MAG: CHRD domain-containing protein, partial [Chitinophagaceae bacterium]